MSVWKVAEMMEEYTQTYKKMSLNAAFWND